MDDSKYEPEPILLVWDFDHTIVDCNSDEYIPSQFSDVRDVQSHFIELMGSGFSWHKCVEIQMSFAVSNGASLSSIKEAAAKMPYLIEVKKSLEDITSLDPEDTRIKPHQVILSDGNTAFIETFLKYNNMLHHFNLDIISNIGILSEHGNLTVTPQSSPNGHTCPRCPSNLCKTEALRQLLAKQFGAKRPQIIYVGDGTNDACPALKILGENDVLLARCGQRKENKSNIHGPQEDQCSEDMNHTSGKEYGILPTLKILEITEKLKPRCKILKWCTGSQLRKHVKELLNSSH